MRNKIKLKEKMETIERKEREKRNCINSILNKSDEKTKE